MDHKTGEDWALASGNWLVGDGNSGAQLKKTKLGYLVSSMVSAADIAIMIKMRRASPDSDPLFPPEFDFSPFDGARLAPNAGPDAVWIAPYGASPMTEQAGSDAVGLRKTRRSMPSAGLLKHDADSPPDCYMDPPPPGSYEFFSGNFGTLDTVLLALDTRKGMLFGWLPASRVWHALDGTESHLLSESALPHRAWRAELAAGFNSQLFLPTEKGLACITPDLASLKYRVKYIGSGNAVGAPIAFDHRVWVPIRQETGMLEFVSIDADNRTDTVALAGMIPPGEVSSPVAYGRTAIWPCTSGQLRLQKMSDGNVAASFTPWADHIEPQFQFGSAYLSGSGALWQLCFDSGLQRYVYVCLSTQQSEQIVVPAPRMCSGRINYLIASKQTNDPWAEPGTGDVGAANMIVLPLIEIGEHDGVIALKMESKLALENLLQSTEKIPAQLICDDYNSETVFHTIAVAEPWELRLFFHKDHLWVYHPGMRRIIGWNIQA